MGHIGHCVGIMSQVQIPEQIDTALTHWMEA